MNKYLLTGVINGHEIAARKFKTRAKAENALVRLTNTYRLELDWDTRNGHDHVYRYDARTWLHINRVAC